MALNFRVLMMCAVLGVACTANAKNFRWASQGDAATLDPHSQNETFNNSINELVYEALTTRGKKMEIIPLMALMSMA